LLFQFDVSAVAVAAHPFRKLGMADIIVVDDEPGIRAMLIDYLTGAGHAVRAAGDGQALRDALSERTADLVLLDLNLPGEDGLSLTRYLRASHELGIVMLTGADGVIDRIVGLEVGADDYVTKPFSLAELAARIDAVLRRRRRMREGRLPFGPFTLDLKHWTLLEPDGTAVPLSGTEIDLIAAFATNEGKVLSRDDILRLAPAHGDDPIDRSIDTRITRLRRKLERDGLTGELITTSRGSGYIYKR
jgi:DNA-binding response OmpR family regulator